MSDMRINQLSDLEKAVFKIGVRNADGPWRAVGFSATLYLGTACCTVFHRSRQLRIAEKASSSVVSPLKDSNVRAEGVSPLPRISRNS